MKNSTVLTVAVATLGVLASGLVLKQAEVDRLKTAIQVKDSTESSAFADCQRILQQDAVQQRLNGCYNGMDKLCEKSNDYIACRNALTPICRDLEARE